MRSIRMWRAPSSAALASSTPLPASTYLAASATGSSSRVGQQRVAQRLQSRLARDLRLGAALRLVGRIQVFQLDLGLRIRDGARQLRRQLALLLDALQHRGAAVLQLAQIAEPLLQLAQLRVVEAAGLLLAVARDERHGRALAQQVHGGRHLADADAQLRGDTLIDLVHCGSPTCERLARRAATSSILGRKPSHGARQSHGGVDAQENAATCEQGRHLRGAIVKNQLPGCVPGCVIVGPSTRGVAGCGDFSVGHHQHRQAENGENHQQQRQQVGRASPMRPLHGRPRSVGSAFGFGVDVVSHVHLQCCSLELERECSAPGSGRQT